MGNYFLKNDLRSLYPEMDDQMTPNVMRKIFFAIFICALEINGLKKSMSIRVLVFIVRTKSVSTD